MGIEDLLRNTSNMIKDIIMLGMDSRGDADERAGSIR